MEAKEDVGRLVWDSEEVEEEVGWAQEEVTVVE